MATVISITRMALVEGTPAEMNLFRREFTAVNQFTNETVLLYEETGRDDRLYIPRGVVQGEGEGSWEETHIEFTGGLRPQQVGLYNSYIQGVVDEQRNGGIIKAETGSGKTVIAISLLTTLAMPTLVVVPTTYLMDQWVDRLVTFTDLWEHEDIGRVQGSVCRPRDVTVGMIHSLCKIDYSKRDPRFYDRFGFVIYDEVHRLGAPTFSETAKKFNCKYTLGLSATPRRKDGLEQVFQHHIGPICGQTNRGKEGVRVIRLNYNNDDTHHEGCVWNGELILGRYLTRVARSQNRNHVIASMIAKMWEKGRQVLLLSDRIAQIKEISRIAQQLGVSRSALGLFTGTVKQPTKQIILGTYGSVGLGADIPRIDTLVLATPRADVEQAVGRLGSLRGGTSEHDPLIVDVVDNSSRIMQRWYFSRLRFYRKLTNDIVEREV